MTDTFRNTRATQPNEHPLAIGRRVYLARLDCFAFIMEIDVHPKAVPGYVYTVQCEWPNDSYITFVHSTDVRLPC